jgi:hypothetical protein
MPVVHRLMHDMELDTAAAAPTVAAGAQHFPSGSKRDNTVRLKELVSARLFTAIYESMALAASVRYTHLYINKCTESRPPLRSPGYVPRFTLPLFIF